jgi:hypothetical protein
MVKVWAGWVSGEGLACFQDGAMNAASPEERKCVLRGVGGG